MGSGSAGKGFADAVGSRRMIEVDEMQPGRLRAAGPLRQTQVLVVSLAAVVQQFQCRRCGSEHDGDITAFGTCDGEVASGISQPLLLLEGLVVFFVDDDEADVRHRRKHGGPRADDELRRA